MQWALKILATAVLVLGWAPAATASPRVPEPARIGGREYVRLSDWAATHGCALKWLKRDETVQVSNHTSTIVLSIDSRQAHVNGVQVWLSFPVTAHTGALWLAESDAQATLQPILSPPKNRAEAKVQNICLDPGHGGKDPGFCVGANQEKRFALLLAQEVRDQLKRVGLNASLTRNSDKYLELSDRPEVAKSRKADLFISLHFNAAENGRDSVQGTQVFCLTPAGADSTNARGEGGSTGWCVGNRNNEKNLYLAYQLQKALTQGCGTEDQGVRRARFAVLRDASMPAVLIEAGFMSHPVEGRKIFSSAYRQQLASAIVDGLRAYKKAVEPGSNGL